MDHVFLRDHPPPKICRPLPSAVRFYVRVILDGTVVKVRLDKRATGISVLVALGVRRD